MRRREQPARPGLQWLLMLAVFGLSVGGCSQAPPLGQVQGRVTFKGQPVTKGTVSFSSDKGDGAEATLGPDGKYVIETPQGGLTPGEYVVTITPEMYLDRSDPKTPPVMEESKAPDIPETYRRTGCNAAPS